MSVPMHTEVAAAYGFTTVRSAAYIQTFVRAGDQGQQKIQSLGIEITMLSAWEDASIAEMADSEDCMRAKAAMPFYRTALRAEGLHLSE